MSTDNVVDLVQAALDRSTVVFHLTVGRLPDIRFEKAAFPLSDLNGITPVEPTRVTAIRIVVPGVREFDWSPPHGDGRRLPFSLPAGESFRLRGMKTALAAQLPALLKSVNQVNAVAAAGDTDGEKAKH